MFIAVPSQESQLATRTNTLSRCRFAGLVVSQEWVDGFLPESKPGLPKRCKIERSMALCAANAVCLDSPP
jgi:hypothetical protein